MQCKLVNIELLTLAYLKMECDLVAINEIIQSEPVLKRGALGLLIAVFVDALKALSDNKKRSDIKLALEFIDEGNPLFIALAHELDIEPRFLIKKVMDDIAARDADKRESIF